MSGGSEIIVASLKSSVQEGRLASLASPVRATSTGSKLWLDIGSRSTPFPRSPCITGEVPTAEPGPPRS
jgi:hypothetical protein